MELASLQRNFEHEKKLLTEERAATEDCLQNALEDVARLRKLKNDMAKKKRAAEGKAATSDRRLDRAQQAEASLHELQQELDMLHESMQTASRETSDSRQSDTSLSSPQHR